MSRNLTTHKKSSLKRTLPYIELLLAFSIIPLFLTAHYLLSIYYYKEKVFGVNTGRFIIDFILYTAIGITGILFLLILHRNFDLKKLVKYHKKK